MNDWLKPQMISKPDLIYLDTWVYRFLMDNTEFTPKMFKYLKENVLFPAVSDILLLEFSPIKQYIEKINYILCFLNSILVKSSEDILNEEVEHYPKEYTNTIIDPNGYLLSDLFELNTKKHLSSNQTKIEWNKYNSDSRKMMPKLNEVINNYPVGKNGKYDKEQAEGFAELITIQWLCQAQPEFITSNFNKDTISNLNVELFKGVQLYAYYIFYKYYIGKREPVKRSELGDLFHLSYIPYCKMAILERDQCSILRKIQKDYPILENVCIENKDFITDL